MTRRRRKCKEQLVAMFGGKCSRCGYDKCQEALQFHHKDSAQKDFGLGSGNTWSMTRLIEEAKKCELVCANCHCEIHSQISKL